MESKAKRVSCFPVVLLAESRSHDQRDNRASSQISMGVGFWGSGVIAEVYCEVYLRSHDLHFDVTLFDVKKKNAFVTFK